MLSFLPSSPASPFDPPTRTYAFLTTPLYSLLQHLHSFLLVLRGPAYSKPTHPIRTICISDTHSQTLSIPDGDILIHAGDLTNTGTAAAIQEQIDWLASLPHKHIIVIAGNHDSYLDARSRSISDQRSTLKWGRITYLQHGGTTLTFPSHGNRTLKIYGAPQIPACGGKEFAFQYPRGEDAWSGTIPLDTDILVTHSPPRWHLDLASGMGCEWLLKETWRVRPRVHVFGHVHAGRGFEKVFWDGAQEAWERICARSGRWSWVGVWIWFDVVRMVWFGAVGVLWAKVWGAEGEGTVMVNAGVVHWKTGTIEYGARAIDV